MINNARTLDLNKLDDYEIERIKGDNGSVSYRIEGDIILIANPDKNIIFNADKPLEVCVCLSRIINEVMVGMNQQMNSISNLLKDKTKEFNKLKNAKKPKKRG